MPYVPENDLKRMSKMLMDEAEIFASNYCFACQHDEPGDIEDVTSQLLKFFGEKIRENEEEQKQKGGC
jgi:hypothetical protein